MFAESHDRRRYRWRHRSAAGAPRWLSLVGLRWAWMASATVTDIGSEHEAVTSFELEHDHRLAVDRTDVERRGREPLGQVEQEARHPLGPDHRPPGGPTFGAAVAEQHHIGVEQRQQGVDVAVARPATAAAGRVRPLTPPAVAERTLWRARWAIWRQLSSVLPTAAAITPNGSPKTSASKNTARSMPDNASSTTRKPSVSDSATSAAAAGSPSASATGSGSHGRRSPLGGVTRRAAVERQPCRRREPGGGILDRVAVGAGPADPSVLDHVLGVGQRPQHSVGEPEQAGPFELERPGSTVGWIRVRHATRIRPAAPAWSASDPAAAPLASAVSASRPSGPTQSPATHRRSRRCRRRGVRRGRCRARGPRSTRSCGRGIAARSHHPP